MKGVNNGHSEDEFVITENHVIMWMFEVFSGGFESSLQTMRWMVAYLLHNPDVSLRMVPPSQNCSFCENCFCHNLKTNKVKYIKVYISRKGISEGIHLNYQIFG